MTRKGSLDLVSLSTRKALAAVLLEKGDTMPRIAEQTGLSLATIKKIKNGSSKVPYELVDHLRSQEEAQLTVLAHEIMGSIDEEAIGKASLQQRVTSGAILLDKRELLAGRATHRVEHTLSKDQIYETLENIYTRLAELKEIRETIEVEAEDAEISDTPDAA